MQHNHRDFDSQPIDAICPEMQLQWNLLMEQCFPGHAKVFQMLFNKLRIFKRISNNQPENNMKFTRNINLDGQYACVECGEILVGSKILEHLHERHQMDCVPYSCAECGYQSSNQVVLLKSDVRKNIVESSTSYYGQASRKGRRSHG